MIKVLVADLIENATADVGYDVCGIARTVPVAVELDRRYEPDLAVIDLRLADGTRGTEIAGRLSTREGSASSIRSATYRASV